MARLLKRPRSPFWYVEYRTASGIRRESTKFRADTREGKRAANRLLNKRLADERQLRHLPSNAAWDMWVVPWIRQHCAGSAATLRAYLGRWNILSMFFRTQGIDYPCQLTYAHCQEYLTWRTSTVKEIKPVGQNTARDDLGTLRLIVGEAIRRDFCLGNPCTQLRIKGAPRKERPEIPDDHTAKIRGELSTGAQENGCPWPKWMRVQFEIAYHTGRRISETKIALRDLDLENCTYTVRIKGGKIKTKPFSPSLLPFLNGIEGTHTHSIGPSHSTRMWRGLFTKLKMPYNFHCIRVSFISRCRRAGIDRWTCLQLADHASALIHAHYNRFSDADLRSALAKLESATPAPGRPTPPQS